MGADTPQWLYSAFVTAMQDVGATASEDALDAEAHHIVERWMDPERKLHGLRHLINVLARIDELASSVHDPDILRVAAWYHGLVLSQSVSILLTDRVPEGTGVECSQTTVGRLTDLGVSADVADRVRELIVAMARRCAPHNDVDAQALVDADMASLSASPQEYKKYRCMLREEYPQLDQLTYMRARRRVVRRLLSRPTVFLSPLAAQWENTARENLEAELARIDEEITRLDPTDSHESDRVLDDDVEVTEGPLDDDPDSSLTATGTLIIRRRKLHKNRPFTDSRASEAPTGVIPVLRPVEDAPEADDDDSDASTLETAIDALDSRTRKSGD